jgi:hypothetical protein
MASNYTKILELANKNNMGLSNTIKRDYGIPLDFSSVQKSYDDAIVYAATNTLAYVGQPIAVGDTLYIVSDQSSGTWTIGEGEAAKTYGIYLKEVGSTPNGDDASIVVNADGSLAIKGFTAAADAYIPQVQVDSQTSERTLAWVSASSLFAPDGNTVSEVVAAQGSAITVTKTKDNTASDKYIYTLDVKLPTPAEYSVKATEDKTTGAVTYSLTKDGEVIPGAEEIVVTPYDDTELAGAVSSLNTTVGTHTEAIAELQKTKTKVDTFLAAADLTEKAIDTLAEIQTYITNDTTGASGMLESIQQNTQAIQTLNGADTVEGSVAKKISDAITAHSTAADGTYATKDALAAVSTKAEAAATKTYVDTELGKKVDTDATTMTNFYNKQEVADLVQDAVDGITGANGETAGTVAADLKTFKELITPQISDIQADLEGHTEQIEANAAGIKAINDAKANEKAQILSEAATAAQGKVDALSTTINTTIGATVEGHTTQISELNTNYNKVSGDVTHLQAAINTEGTGLNARVGALEQADIQLDGRITANDSAIKTVSKTASDNTTAIGTLTTTVENLGTTVSQNTAKFDNYYTSAEVDTKIAEEIGKIDNSDLEDLIQANADAIAAEITRADAEEKRIAAIANKNTTSIETIAGQVTGLNTTLNSIMENEDGTALNSIKELAVWVENHGKDAAEFTKNISANAAAIAVLNGNAETEGSVQKIVADAIADIPAIPLATSTTPGLVMGSDHISIEANGAMKINMGLFTTDSLQQGTKTLVLNGGSASK